MARRLSKTQREALLTKLRNGHDLDAARASLSITAAQIEAGGDTLARDIAEAFRTGTSRLRARIMESALEADHAPTLLRLLEQREAAAMGSDSITEVRRVIIDGRCKTCGQRSGQPPDLSLLTTEQLRQLEAIACVLSGEEPAQSPPRRHPLGALGEQHRDTPTPPAPHQAAEVVKLHPRPSYMNPGNGQYNPPQNGDRS